MGQQFKLRANIRFFDSLSEYFAASELGADDAILISGSVQRSFSDQIPDTCPVLVTSQYHKGEPTVDQADAIRADLPGHCRRIIAIGGGTVLDLAKMLIMKTPSGTTEELFLAPEQAECERALVAIPATCGTGSEITGTTVSELPRLHTKRGVTMDALVPAETILIPELLKELPYSVFATSSVDALIHAAESFMSPNATPHSTLFSREAIRLILRGYRCVLRRGPKHWADCAREFLLASDYAGIAFSSAGCAAVHALSYPLGGEYHIPHGEANSLVFAAVFHKYKEKEPGGRLAGLAMLLSDCLNVPETEALDALFAMVDEILPRKPLRDYGIPHGQLALFAESVLKNQTRLLKNNYVPLSREDMLAIYESVY